MSSFDHMLRHDGQVARLRKPKQTKEHSSITVSKPCNVLYVEFFQGEFFFNAVNFLLFHYVDKKTQKFRGSIESDSMQLQGVALVKTEENNSFFLLLFSSFTI